MARKDRRITAEDLWKIERPSQPTLSPDGAQACISVSRYDMAENKGRSSLWLLSTFGGGPRRLTSCGEKDGHPAWSPSNPPRPRTPTNAQERPALIGSQVLA